MLRGRGRPLIGPRVAPVALTLFLALFAAQGAMIAVSPVLAELARDFEVSTATAGQLRSVSGLVAGLAALALGGLMARFGLRDLLVAGLLLLALGSGLSAAAPSFAVLALAQVAIGAGVAVVLAGALAAAAQWAPADRRAHALSWALVGQPAAWIVGMPLVGVLGDSSWRWGWIALPLAASLIALLATASRPADAEREARTATWPELSANGPLRRWALAELLAYSAWAGTLVFAGALVVESYDASPGTAGLVLGAAALAYLPGNFAARRQVDTRARELLAVLPLGCAALVVAFGAYRPDALVSALLLAALACLAGGRTIAGSTLGLEVCAQRRLFAMRIRAGATQFGYLFGSALGGLALALWGYGGLGVALGCLFAASALPHARALRRRAAAAPVRI